MLQSPTRANRLIGQSQETAALRRMIEKAAHHHRLPVLLLGESGTGKEVVARAIHESNPRGEFVPIDCGALVGSLMESDLFGHVKGSFTGSAETKKGLVEMADGGTAFFDEIGDLPLEMQVKLLRLIQESEFRPVGALHWRKVNIRIIAATHRELRKEVDAGRFRLDLYYRLNVFPIRLPPLRQRKEDIPLLAEHFLDMYREQGVETMDLDSEVLNAFQHYDWPGNVRELKHCIDRMTAMRSAGALQMADLPSALLYHQSANSLDCLSEVLQPVSPGALPRVSLPSPPPVVSLPDSERHTIVRALQATGGERAKTAKLLGIGRTTLYRKMKQYGME